MKVSERKKVTAALVASVLLHAIALVLLMIWGSSHGIARPMSALTQPSRQIVVTIMAPTPSPTPRLAPLFATPTPKPIAIDSSGLATADKAPAHPLFESDVNSAAASKLAPTGRAPAPSQEGKERAAPEFETKNFSLGPPNEPPQLEMAPAPEQKIQKSPAKKITAKPAQTVTPAPTPTAASTPEQTPRPVVRARPTPRPIPLSTAEPSPGALAFRPPASPEPSASASETPLDEIPRPTPLRTVQQETPEQTLAMMATPAPRRPRRPVYQSNTEETRVEGSISNRGAKPGLDAASTPLGRYRKRIADAIGSRWYYYIGQQMSLISVGSVHIKFYINEKGHVEDVKILANSANSAFGDFSVQSIIEADLPALPGDLAPKLENGRLEVDYTFTIYPE